MVLVCVLYPTRARQEAFRSALPAALPNGRGSEGLCAARNLWRLGQNCSKMQHFVQ
jgi:hypothetical protein